MPSSIRTNTPALDFASLDLIDDADLAVAELLLAVQEQAQPLLVALGAQAAVLDGEAALADLHPVRIDLAVLDQGQRTPGIFVLFVPTVRRGTGGHAEDQHHRRDGETCRIRETSSIGCASPHCGHFSASCSHTSPACFDRASQGLAALGSPGRYGLLGHVDPAYIPAGHPQRGPVELRLRVQQDRPREGRMVRGSRFRLEALLLGQVLPSWMTITSAAPAAK